MPQENVEIVRGLATAFEERGVDALRDYCDLQVEWHEDPSFPEADVYRGLEAVEVYSAQFLSEFSEIHYEVADATYSGDHVVANLEINGVGRTSGAEFKISAWWAVTIRGTRITQIFAYLDRSRALEAVGLAE